MIVIVAGAPLSPSTLHCAGIGRWAFADDIRLNAYRLADNTVVAESRATEPTARRTNPDARARTAALIATIPDDLSIPDLLKRGPKS
jgi:hypothetical protein